jgi:hypothetical protein
MEDKKYILKPEEIKELIDTQIGCMATDRITVDGLKIGFMYREEPSKEYSDSGWRFFAGDETEEYMSNPRNIGIYKLNTICNYDEDIISFLESDYGTAYYRDIDGKFKKDATWEKPTPNSIFKR